MPPLGEKTPQLLLHRTTCNLLLLSELQKSQHQSPSGSPVQTVGSGSLDRARLLRSFSCRHLREKHREEDPELSLHCFDPSRGWSRNDPWEGPQSKLAAEAVKEAQVAVPCLGPLGALGLCMECWAVPIATVVVSCSCVRWWNTGGAAVQ